MIIFPQKKKRKPRAKKQFKDWVVVKGLTAENFNSVHVLEPETLNEVARRLFSDTHAEYSVDGTHYLKKQELCDKGSGFHVLEQYCNCRVSVANLLARLLLIQQSIHQVFTRLGCTITQ